MKIAKSDGGERTTVAALRDRLIVILPHKVGESVTKFSPDPTRWVDTHVWTVDVAGVPTPVGADGGTAVRFWSEVLTPVLAESLDEYVGARIIQPSAAYLFDELDDDEIARCEHAVKIIEGAEVPDDNEPF